MSKDQVKGVEHDQRGVVLLMVLIRELGRIDGILGQLLGAAATRYVATNKLSVATPKPIIAQEIPTSVHFAPSLAAVGQFARHPCPAPMRRHTSLARSACS